ncbi:protein of unknown function DUF22 [Methanobacterium lacus]|uniref:DUF22 domain-containing protein n=1 Tax=Methanobacterium lacus (strain AL-21) TaxID=877455 RepID=F0T970_METLA|nr:DUF22 domain-containing protein [Methanobacterium lacus]ADZ08692.1 protein of unknown function DUF22 [Methanobacterium lacus]
MRIITRLDAVKKELAQAKAEKLDFQVGSISGNLRAIIANEDMEFQSGNIKSIEIKEIPIPANYLSYLSGYGSNSYGHTLAVDEEIPLPLSMERKADHAMFAAAKDCEIKKDDLLGVLILLPVHLTH